MNHGLHEIARTIYRSVLERIGVGDALRDHVRVSGRLLFVSDLQFDLDAFDDLLVVALGKAAAPMCETALALLAPAGELHGRLRAIAVGPAAPLAAAAKVTYLEGSHPLPNERALLAARTVLAELGRCTSRSLVLFLVSGGASAMLEDPLDATIPFDDAVQFHRALVGSGLPITQMNALRKHFSRVKGGRLAVAAQGATQCTLLVSDVPEASLHVIASGPSLPDPSTAAECRAIVQQHRAALLFPAAVFRFFLSGDLPETPKPDHAAFRRAHWRALLSSADLSRHAANIATTLGFHVAVDNTCDDWPYNAAARYLLQRMQHLRQSRGRVCLISVGELSVILPRDHGAGGRNQQFALECARILEEEGLPFTVLSAGSDGVDGTSPAAGAIADASTNRRARGLHLDPAAALRSFDSYPLFRALGDAIVTGPTGTNLRDLRLVLSEDAIVP